MDGVLIKQKKKVEQNTTWIQSKVSKISWPGVRMATDFQTSQIITKLKYNLQNGQ